MVTPFHCGTHGKKGKRGRESVVPAGSLPLAFSPWPVNKADPDIFSLGDMVDSELKCFPWLRLRKQKKHPGVAGKTVHEANKSPLSS